MPASQQHHRGLDAAQRDALMRLCEIAIADSDDYETRRRATWLKWRLEREGAPRQDCDLVELARMRVA